MELSSYNFLKEIYNQSINKSQIFDVKKTKSKNLKELNSNGYTIIKNCLDLKTVDNIKNEFDKNIYNLKNIVYPRNVEKSKIINGKVLVDRISKKEFNLGENYFRNISDKVQFKDPLQNSNFINDIIFNEKIISTAYNYFGQMPHLTYFKIEKNYKNDLKNFDTQLFHFDENAFKLLKVFIYLDDVLEIGHGPFTYVKKSHKNIEKFWNKKVSPSVTGRAARWDDKKIIKTFGKESMTPIFAKKGDVILANTIAFHKGTKPKTRDRYIIIYNLGIHKDYIGYQPDKVPTIKKKYYNNLTKKQKYILKLLEKN